MLGSSARTTSCRIRSHSHESFEPLCPRGKFDSGGTPGITTLRTEPIGLSNIKWGAGWNALACVTMFKHWSLSRSLLPPREPSGQ